MRNRERNFFRYTTKSGSIFRKYSTHPLDLYINTKNSLSFSIPYIIFKFPYKYEYRYIVADKGISPLTSLNTKDSLISHRPSLYPTLLFFFFNPLICWFLTLLARLISLSYVSLNMSKLSIIDLFITTLFEISIVTRYFNLPFFFIPRFGFDHSLLFLSSIKQNESNEQTNSV